jgi:hypothetical protein
MREREREREREDNYRSVDAHEYTLNALNAGFFFSYVFGYGPNCIFMLDACLPKKGSILSIVEMLNPS